MVEHSILCALALSRKKDDLFQDLATEEDCHYALIEWVKEDFSESAAKISGFNTPYLIMKNKVSTQSIPNTQGEKNDLDDNNECDSED